MGKKDHKIRVRMKDGLAEVKLLLQHPMETGNRTDPTTGLRIPRHFIRELDCDLNGNTILRADWSWGMARRPYLSFRIRGARSGDHVRVWWIDDRGNDDVIEAIAS